MKVILLFALIAATAAGTWPITYTSLQSDQQGEIHSESGHTIYTYESSDGTKVFEQGILKPNADGTGSVLVKKGSVEYTSPEGKPIKMLYVADEKGTQITSDDVPVPLFNPNAFNDGWVEI
ncbi:larval cuticle protein LCP-17-like isoform X2 [Bacillus rossius redtenbacheri]|uniref:larval cuticle protein LCP-17-like isoform X2 n=1 Tax=Bacillus rossius redtenbacheri TaxID=93214 RepID=UPI002FDD0EDB